MLARARAEIHSLKDTCETALRNKGEMRAELEARISDLAQRLQEMQALAARECRLREETDRLFQNHPTDLRKLLQQARDLKESARYHKQCYESAARQNLEVERLVHKLLNEAETWKTQFTNLVEFANKIVRDIPKIHKETYAEMHPDNTPQAVFNFVDICGVMLKAFKANLEIARKVKF